MTTLAQFYSNVNFEVKRGQTFVSQIPQYVNMALSFIERSHVFLHTENYASITLSAESENPTTIVQPTGFRGMYFWRHLLSTDDNGNPIDPSDPNANNYERINHVDPFDMDSIGTGKPRAYWQQGKQFFWLDKVPDKDYPTQMGYNAFTVLPTDTTQSPYVIQAFGDVILYQTMLLMAPAMRNMDIVNLYKPLRDELFKSLIDADVEERQQSRSESMQYGWEFKEEVNRSLLAAPYDYGYYNG